ncbi:replicative DNA helicase [Anaerotignum propionicum]|uniref:replicative DNA helicase n=1 Tax=Anaerotignum propionicum TaxID=28446 RepID=UPI00289D6B3A|nr:replicative DNA helicase [Anaerotignum propionicum]
MAEKKLVKPYSLETEKAALGSMFLDPGAAVQGCGLLKEEDFYSPTNKILFVAMAATVQDSGVADLSLVWRRLEQERKTEQVHFSYLSEVAMSVGTSINLPRYAEELRQLSYYRRCIDNGRKMMEAAYKQDENGISESLSNLREDGVGTDEPKTAAKVMAEYLQDLSEQRKSGKIFSGLQTGFVDLDLLTGGLRADDLYIIAGRPAMGKTALALDISRGCAKSLFDEGKSVVFFSLEMNERDIVARLYCGETGADNVMFSLRENDDAKWAEFLRTFEKNGDFFEHMAKNIVIDDSNYITPENMRAKCHGMRIKGKEIGLIVIDYLQLMSAGKGDNRVQELSHISRSLKLLAKDFHCPVVALSQLSRQVETRQDKRPMLSDLRESGSIEQDADAVMFVYRDEYYYPESEKKGVAEVIMGKQRKGPVGTVELAWLPHATTFRNLARNTGAWKTVKEKSPWEEGHK